MNIRKEKGITLVALIITVIIALILAGVGADILVKKNLTNRAKKARTDYSESMAISRIQELSVLTMQKFQEQNLDDGDYMEELQEKLEADESLKEYSFAAAEDILIITTPSGRLFKLQGNNITEIES